MSEPDYIFDLHIDGATHGSQTMNYICRNCGVSEQGGAVPNPGLHHRMRAHLREAHSEPPDQKFSVVHQELSHDAARVEFSRTSE